MEMISLFETDSPAVDEQQLTARQQTFLLKLRVHDKKVCVSRELGKLIFRGPVIGNGPLPDEGAA